jgi:tetratricopeptide (TPR) repeat protein
MFILYLYSADPATLPQDSSMAYGAEELAYQAADLQPDYCPALLNLTLFNGMEQPADSRLTTPSGGVTTWTKYYSPEGCRDPALLYYRAQNSIAEVHPFSDRGKLGSGIDTPSGGDPSQTLKLIEGLVGDPEWAGLAHSVRGDAYYWHGVYSLERASAYPRPFTARRYFKLALQEYDSALAMQPDEVAIRNGKALTYMKLREATEAVREAKAAVKAAPDSYWTQQTLTQAYEAKGEFAAAARITRDTLSLRSPVTLSPVALVPYAPVSHGADLYSDLRVIPPIFGRAGGVLLDDEVIVPFEPEDYYPSAMTNSSAPGESISIVPNTCTMICCVTIC